MVRLERSLVLFLFILSICTLIKAQPGSLYGNVPRRRREMSSTSNRLIRDTNPRSRGRDEVSSSSNRTTREDPSDNGRNQPDGGGRRMNPTPRENRLERERIRIRDRDDARDRDRTDRTDRSDRDRSDRGNGSSNNIRPDRSHHHNADSSSRSRLRYDGEYPYYASFVDSFNRIIAEDLYTPDHTVRGNSGFRPLPTNHGHNEAPDVSSHPIYGTWM